MMVQKVTSAKVSITLADLALMALVLAKQIGTDKKIQVIKALRDMARDMTLVCEDGSPLVTWTPCPKCRDSWCVNSKTVPVVAGLKECKDALDGWYEGRQFIG
jgi:hypothetical protein